MNSAWQLVRLAVWWNGIGGIVIAVLTVLALANVIRPAGLSDFPLDAAGHWMLLGIAGYLVGIWLCYLAWWRRTFVASVTVRWRLLALLLLTFVWVLGLDNHQESRLRDELRMLRANQRTLTPN